MTKDTGNGNKLGAGRQLSVLAMGARERNVNSGQYVHTRCIFIFIYMYMYMPHIEHKSVLTRYSNILKECVAK